MIKALQNSDVFMVGCEVSDDVVLATMIWAKTKRIPDIAGQPTTLTEPHRANGTELTVILPEDLEEMYTHARMKRVFTLES